MLKLPIKHFWLLNKNIDRLAAEEDQRQLMLLVAAQSEKGHDAFVENARKTIGDVVVYDEDALAQEQIARAEAERDREGLMALKGMGKWS